MAERCRHLGHTHLETTEIYLHTTAKEGLRSPLDDLPGVIPFERHKPTISTRTA